MLAEQLLGKIGVVTYQPYGHAGFTFEIRTSDAEYILKSNDIAQYSRVHIEIHPIAQCRASDGPSLIPDYRSEPAFRKPSPNPYSVSEMAGFGFLLCSDALNQVTNSRIVATVMQESATLNTGKLIFLSQNISVTFELRIRSSRLPTAPAARRAIAICVIQGSFGWRKLYQAVPTAMTTATGASNLPFP